MEEPQEIIPRYKVCRDCSLSKIFAFHEIGLFTEEINRPESEVANYVITPSESKKITGFLDEGKVILANRRNRTVPIFIECRMCWPGKDYNILRDIISEKFPEFYETFIVVMEHTNKVSGRNMFIMKYEDFVSYSEWLFAVMSEFERRLPVC